MLSLTTGGTTRNCEGVSRRELLRIGTLGMAGLSLPQLLAAESAAGRGFVRDRAVVLVFLGGGPSHIETFNPNMDAPAPYHSLTGDVETTVPGLRFGGTFPQLAKVAHEMAIVRSYAHGNSDHGRAVPYVLSGGHTIPCGMGAAYARLRGANDPATGLPTTGLVTAPEIGRFANPRKRIIDGSQAGPFGVPFAPFDPNAEGPLLENMTVNVDETRLADRRHLLSRLDRLRRRNDENDLLAGIDGLRQQAFDILAGAAAEAFDLQREDPRTLARYDTSNYRVGEKPEDIRPCTLGKQMLLARRLVEAGCGFVTVANCGWDMHASSGNGYMSLTAGMQMLGNPLDRALSAFIEDLRERGLLDKVLLVVTGEFGRTPNVNRRGGRDHWGNLCTLAMAGGGVCHGQTIGRSARNNDVPDSDPIGPENVMATLMHNLLDVGVLRVTRGVPRQLLAPIETHAPIPELV